MAIDRRTVATVIFAALGIFAPIAYDRYQHKKSLELRQLSSSSIVSDELRLVKLQVMYGGKPIPTLTKLSFALVNSGRTPIRSEDLVDPPRIGFPATTEILEFQPDSAIPPEAKYSARLESTHRSLQLSFPLLNPQEELRFSVLVSGSPTGYNATAHIAGAPRLGLAITDRQNSRGILDLPWTVYVVGLFTLFVWVLFAGVLEFVGEISATKKLYLAAKIARPSPPTREAYQEYVGTTLYPAIEVKRGKQLQGILKALPPASVLTAEQTRLLEEQVSTGLEKDFAVWGAALIMLALAVAGTAYVLSSVFHP